MPYFLKAAVKGKLLKEVLYFSKKYTHFGYNRRPSKGWVATPCGKCWLHYWVTQLDEMHKFSSAIYGEALSGAAPIILSVEK
jgi:hypothetical protein